MAMKIQRVEDCALLLTGQFSAGAVKFEYDAEWDLQRDKLVVVKARLYVEDPNQQPLEAYNCVLSEDRGSLAQHFEFGPVVKGMETMSLRVEGPPGIHYITGIVDDKELVPIRIQGCPCRDSPEFPKSAFVINSNGKTRALELDFSDAIRGDLAELSSAAAKEARSFRLSQEVVEVALHSY